MKDLTNYLRRKTASEEELQAADMIEKLREELAAEKKDAERYRWLREQHWSKSKLCAVKDPSDAVKIGYSCPSLGMLDEEIDAAMKEQQSMSKCREAFVALYKVPESQADFDYEPINPLHSVWKAWQAAWNARPSEELAAEREKVKALEREVAHWKNNHETEVRRARALKERTDMPLERVQAYEKWGKDMEQLAAAQAMIAQMWEALRYCKEYIDGTVAAEALVLPNNQDALHEALALECERLAGVVTNSRHLLREEAAAHRARKETK